MHDYSYKGHIKSNIQGWLATLPTPHDHYADLQILLTDFEWIHLNGLLLSHILTENTLVNINIICG